MNVTPSLCSLRRALAGLTLSALALAACDSTPSSPWPKFRANAWQDGRSSAAPRNFDYVRGVDSYPVARDVDGAVVARRSVEVVRVGRGPRAVTNA